ncbi:MAG: amino acid adenylation domain-containing protein, partial [bacterium]|nr:amino acid adenylation domain-containing protein [bacterium]
LKEKGVQTDTIVGIMMNRSLEMIIGIMGILKSGGAYLPIDPDSPKERIRFMLEDSGTKIIVTSGLDVNGLDGLIVINPGDANEFLNRQTNNATNQQTNLAYVIYTSGSTGRPKGVLVQHDSAVNLITSQLHHLNMGQWERVLQYSNIYFDASVEQIFTALSCGGVLVLVCKAILMDSNRFDLFLLDNCITHLNAAPSFLTHLRLNFPGSYSLRRIITGGDVCPVPLAMRLSRHCAFYNEYGPTETTVMMLRMKVEELTENLSHVPVGKPISNTAAYILDQWRNPVPISLTGELYIGGQCVTRGYLNRPELTAERFVMVPGSRLLADRRKGKTETSGTDSIRNQLSAMSRLYKTGDLGRWLLDGNIEFLGRVDHQVKIRGFRIELGEIESQVLKHPEVKDAVVVSMGGQGNDKYLCAYFVPGD